MNTALWILAAILAVVMLGAGLFKLTQSKEALAAKGMSWVEDFSGGAVKAIGLSEVLGAVGLILPAVLGVMPILVPIAATCLAVAMAGAIAVHVRRHEGMRFLPAAVMLVIAVIVAWGRFGSYAF